MKYITKEDIEDFFPNSLDVSLAETKGLATNNELNDKYYLLLSKYYKYLYSYIEKNAQIKKIESVLEETNKNFKEVLDDDKDIYQYLSPNKFFYIRNTLYVENLSKEDIEKILQSDVYNDDIEEVISRTYKSVITFSTFENTYADVMYGIDNASFIAPKDNLILGLRFISEENLKYSSDDEWFEDYSQRRDIINSSMEKLIEVLSYKIKCGVSILEYTEENVIAKKNKNEIKK